MDGRDDYVDVIPKVIKISLSQNIEVRDAESYIVQTVVI